MNDKSAISHLTHSRNTLGTSLIKEDQNSELVTKYEQTVGAKYEQLQHREYQVDISEHKIKQYRPYSAAEVRKGSGR